MSIQKIGLKDCVAMVKQNVSLETIHGLHKNSITCPLCLEKWEEIQKKTSEAVAKGICSTDFLKS